jgi:hypothetical protein
MNRITSRLRCLLCRGFLALCAASLGACSSKGSGGGSDAQQDHTLRWDQGKWDVQQWGK